ncbi:MAG: TrkH family potassium uptake protein [Emcibacteraceae bacterium]|nr:TrkH family potassium uptake protein [Emcibacteraceae bacterium]MDG1997129.1 TrkH family potassium uptake protein [Emcibacteraceae bacterium]
MVDFRPIWMVSGIFLIIIGIGMLFPVMVDLYVSNPDWEVFALISGIVLFVGGSLYLGNRGDYDEFTVQQAFLLTFVSWLIMPAAGALPFVFSELSLSYTDAYFEAMSGISTTGSTVITGLDTAPPGILLWRSMLQWFGGVGIIVMAVAILPLLQIGGMQLFKIESFDVSDKLLPRATQLASALSLLYIGLTIICAVAFWLVGMSPFEAICHAFTTIATGGFSTSDGSIGHFDSALIDYTVTIFMIVGSLPFLLYLRLLRGQSKGFYHDSQVRWFLALTVILISLMVVWVWMTGIYDWEEALRYTTFNVVSILTGTGYATADYTAWGALPVMIFFFIMFIGGCAGSTSCGIKIFRFQVLVSMTSAHFKKLLRPNGIFIPRYNGGAIDDSVTGSVMSYLFLFVVCFILLSLALTLTGLDFVTAVSGAGTAMANVGPAIGPIIGPSGTFQELPDVSKWLLTFGMLLGRLELFAVLVLFSPKFWAR